MKYEPADVFFIAGEPSGDLQAALLASELRRRAPALRITGIGGPKLAQAGASVIYDSSELASIGPLSAIPLIPRLLGVLLALTRNLTRRPPGLLVPVDAGGFNIPLLRRLRRHGYAGRVLYYFPPGAWVDNERQARAVAECSLPLTPFSHQRDFYRGLGLPVEYFGHPLVSLIHERPAQPPASVAPQVGLLPGSRREEVARHVPVLAAAARELEQRAGARFTIVASSAKRAEQIARCWADAGGPPTARIANETVAQALLPVDLALVASGTAVLEAALLGVPQVTFYTVSAAQYRIALRKLPAGMQSITLPNLVLRRAIVPELIQDNFTAAHIVSESMRLLQDGSSAREQQLAYRQLRSALGPADALTRIGEFAARFMAQSA
ncbi:MAG: hypothetical protein M3Z37_06455 [Candidatus Eremiobacteraeota bacterium]|nr:hypothetical protein [Candidatus Eremiobacteraeota bacterium]